MPALDSSSKLCYSCTDPEVIHYSSLGTADRSPFSAAASPVRSAAAAAGQGEATSERARILSQVRRARQLLKGAGVDERRAAAAVGATKENDRW